MPLDTSLTARDGIQNLGDSVADIVLHHIADKQPSQENPHYGVDQVQVVGLGRVEVFRQEGLYPVYQHLQYQGGQGREDTNQEAEYQDEPFFLDVLLAPDEEPLQQIFPFSLHAFYCLMIFMTPPLSSLMMLDGLALPVSSRR